MYCKIYFKVHCKVLYMTPNITLPGHSGTVGNSVALYLQDPRVDPELGLLYLKFCMFSLCLYMGFLQVLQFPSTSPNLPIGGLAIN